MTPEEIKLVQTSFEKVLLKPEQAAACFYRRLFEFDPAMRPMFKTDMRQQGRKLIDMLRAMVEGLSFLDEFVSAIHKLGQRHVEYGVRPAHYKTLGMALFGMLEEVLGPAYTSEVAAAWVAAYALFETLMLEGATGASAKQTP